MIKQHSWTRQQYMAGYRLMRQGISFEMMWDVWPHLQHIAKAADYSYQASDYLDGGWISNKRRERFYAIKCRILIQREELPF